MSPDNSATWFNRAQKVIPGGVNSPVRAFKSVGGIPRFIEKGEGAYLIDVDGQRYIDYVGSWGPLILGHAHPEIVKRVQEVASQGMTFGAPTPLEVEMAETVCQLVPSIEQIRMCSSGTEATMSVIRLARGFTKRDDILKFTGCYHGHHDALLVQAGSGLLTLGIPECPGIPIDATKHTYTLPFNDLNSLEEFFKAHGNQLACVILEPIACNMNLVEPKAEFLPKLRSLCDHYGTLLIFDEVITGFRVGLSGAQGYYGISPDLTTFGKIIGGGLPVGAYGGRYDIMQHIAPAGSIYQAGTLSGNPVTMAAGLATLQIIQQPGFYEQLEIMMDKFTNGMKEIALKHQIPLQIKSIASLFGIFFTNEVEINDFNAVSCCNLTLFKLFFHEMLERGIYFAPSAFEVGSISAVHTNRELEKTFAAADEAFAVLKTKIEV